MWFTSIYLRTLRDFRLAILGWSVGLGLVMFEVEAAVGSLDVLLSLPRERARVALEKLAAVWTALLLMGLLITFAGGKSFNADYSLGDALLFGLNLALISGVFGSIALLLSQFTQERGAAAGATGGLY